MDLSELATEDTITEQIHNLAKRLIDICKENLLQLSNAEFATFLEKNYENFTDNFRLKEKENQISIKQNQYEMYSKFNQKEKCYFFNHV